MIAALFVVKNGPYYGITGIDPWDQARDARSYPGGAPVIAHPPCERWGRYWSGGPSAKVRRLLGDDNGCFASALASVRTHGGLLEHPEASHAFRKYGLPLPDFNGGWTDPDLYGGSSCCVAQGNYGHAAQKMTWLYAIIPHYPDLLWGKSPDKIRMDPGFHSREERARAIKTGVCQRLSKRLSKRQRLITPEPFRNLLIGLVQGTVGGS